MRRFMWSHFRVWVLPFELTHLISLTAACRLHRGTFVVIPHHNYYYSPIFHNIHTHTHRLTMAFSCRTAPRSGRDFTERGHKVAHANQKPISVASEVESCATISVMFQLQIFFGALHQSIRTSICICAIDKIGIGLDGVSYSTFGRFSSQKFYGSIEASRICKTEKFLDTFAQVSHTHTQR